MSGGGSTSEPPPPVPLEEPPVPFWFSELSPSPAALHAARPPMLNSVAMEITRSVQALRMRVDMVIKGSRSEISSQGSRREGRAARSRSSRVMGSALRPLQSRPRERPLAIEQREQSWAGAGVARRHSSSCGIRSAPNTPATAGQDRAQRDDGSEARYWMGISRSFAARGRRR
jgi:hypothetical protein